MFKPHHLSIVEKPYKYEEYLWMIPELLQEIEDPKILTLYSDYLLNCSGQAVEYGYQFVVKDISFFKELGKSKYISYLIAAEDEYFDELPLFFEDQWDTNFSLDGMLLLGWTVNKFSEPAIFFGIYPIVKNGKKYIVENESLINKWGLINDYENAREIAKKNTEVDPEGERWRVLAVYVDEITLKKINMHV